MNDALQDRRLGYSIKELARGLGVCMRTIVNHIDAGHLTVRHVGRRVIVPAESARKFLLRDRPLTKKSKKA